MNKKEQVIYSALLHDIGKLVMRADTQKTNHMQAGVEFVEQNISESFIDDSIINAIKYHHFEDLKKANLKSDDISFIIYEADNVSAALDRRENDENLNGFNLHSPLYSVFNILNENKASYGYELKVLKKSNDVIGLLDAGDINNDVGRYSIVRDELIASLNKMNKTLSPNSLLRLLELTTSFIPSSTNRKEHIDISLFDHLKTTAMIANNIYDYYESTDVQDYKSVLLDDKDTFRDTNIHLLLKADISGIQNFIYNIPSENALKNLRARSFYLELFTENIVDELLNVLELTRCNLIYSGGGAFQMLIPNTQKNKDKIKIFIKNINYWILKQYNEKIYIAINYVECNSNDLANNMSSVNKDENLLGNKHRELSKLTNYKKINRYTHDELLCLYNTRNTYNQRECKICKTSVFELNEQDICYNCEALKNMGMVLNKFSETYIVVTNDIINKTSIEIFSNLDENYMSIVNQKEAEDLLKNGKLKRLYTINQDNISINYATDIMYGGSESNLTLSDLSNSSIGDKLLGVLRIDVDQLSLAFIKGFSRDNETDFRFNTISRSTSLSRLINIFFKSEVRKLINNKFTFNKICLPRLESIKEFDEYNINIVYSGGDDLFAVGAWNDLLEFAINLNKEFNLFSANTLTLSAGFSVFNPKTPILKLANLVGELESVAKNNGRNSICLFNEDYVFKWDEFEDKVISKLNKFYDWFSFTEEKDKLQYSTSFYNLRMLITQKDFYNKKVKNISKIAYSIAKIIEGSNNKELCDDFSNQILEWCRKEEEIKYLDISMMLVIYLNRKR